MNYALIENKLVSNIIVLDSSTLSSFPNAILIQNNLSVGIGDKYEDGVFYHDGKAIESVDTPITADQLLVLQSLVNESNITMSELILNQAQKETETNETIAALMLQMATNQEGGNA